jgi:hypothetical protein
MSDVSSRRGPSEALALNLRINEACNRFEHYGRFLRFLEVSTSCGKYFSMDS